MVTQSHQQGERYKAGRGQEGVNERAWRCCGHHPVLTMAHRGKGVTHRAGAAVKQDPVNISCHFVFCVFHKALINHEKQKRI